ncbi:hypothetical protein A3770_11p64040 [Chloropicon primus]|uniref:Uncharacterized protein n=1 Tax=Chloropicon primus TaxID=1764295 RepID=A0A5B8MU93_9CHLO|nr:hypothetical protein A3770_11p64040 [Chloropicon primus]|eukprot:QDZ23886.1 hypothetical protein A3770_11p64040 [Chloropicon primus]
MEKGEGGARGEDVAVAEEDSRGMALSRMSPVSLRDVFLEQQREIRNAEDRVMQLQCTYNEEKVRMQKVTEEYNLLKAETERNNQRLIEVTEETLQLQKEFQGLCREIEDLNCSKLHLSSQMRLLKQEYGQVKYCFATEGEDFEIALKALEGANAEIEDYNRTWGECELVRELKSRADEFTTSLKPPQGGGGEAAGGASIGAWMTSRPA